MSSFETATQIPLKVSIAGEGIGGLAAAIALRRNSHLVQIFETERNAEVGAAIAVPIDSQRVLESFGYSKENPRGVKYEGFEAFEASGSNRTCLAIAVIYTPSSNTWSLVPETAHPRFYTSPVDS
ncbi:hypothetical protein B0H17DRAFT_1210020 [Mycena rosella]|uniref:FAD-binding domain-containing protein n=1 Tax=Mycena rosella TaxID=1033263 RepID=A0AAD7CXG2_MYCRO|nr:hypothetical protein B0H17DRAFT_1210020 [Mycena rosella]